MSCIVLEPDNTGKVVSKWPSFPAAVLMTDWLLLLLCPYYAGNPGTTNYFVVVGDLPNNIWIKPNWILQSRFLVIKV